MSKRPLSELTEDQLLDEIERAVVGSPFAELVYLIRYCRDLKVENATLRARIIELGG